ncbi:MAG: hypothetical protein KAW81_04755 [Dehalococcoidia bacterium]|nr:hypothetical protein [Dehalococcoidia bacterium]
MGKRVEQIFRHPFCQQIVDDIRPALDILHRELEELERSGRLQFVETPQQPTYQPTGFSRFDRYVTSVFEYISRLEKSFRRLEHIRAYLAHFRILKQYKGAGVNLAEYVQYHYSNHAITLVGICDLALILTNNTFCLGFPPRQCRQEIITENYWVCKAKVDEVLKRLNSTVEPLREPRNLFVHRGFPRSSPRIIYLDMSENLGVGRPYKAEISRIIGKLKEEEEPVFGATIELLSGLHPVYKFWKGILSAREKRNG